jgi:hypothetical protein
MVAEHFDEVVVAGVDRFVEGCPAALSCVRGGVVVGGGGLGIRMRGGEGSKKRLGKESRIKRVRNGACVRAEAVGCIAVERVEGSV